MAIATKIESIIEKSSWIRKMFEEGARLKQMHGADNVFDFSLGNPNVPPPEMFKNALTEVASDPSLNHGYMPNFGYPPVRKVVAETLSREQGVPVSENNVIMTCGAAGGLNVVLKALLDPGDEMIVPAPYFVEYGFYADNHGGVMKVVPTQDDFQLDLDAMESAIGPRTKTVLINTPHNPTGVVYPESTLRELGRLLQTKSRETGRTIYLLSDEPYRKIVYDNVTVPSIFQCYDESIVVTSYSKDLSIPGERLGYIAINPKTMETGKLFEAMTLTNRILGFVNAPAFMQRVVEKSQGAHVDVSEYARKRALICDGLKEAGYDFVTPRGAFYVFPKSPIENEVDFVTALQDELILAVPGGGFGKPGYFRLVYCVSDETIKGAMPGFKRVMEKFR